MKYTKPPLTLQEQLEHIQNFCHIQIKDKQKALYYLKHCNYYKLRGYWLYYKKNLYHLTEVRNRCAHHSRIWNHSFIHRFEIPKKYKNILSSQNFKLSHTFVVMNDLLAVIEPKNQFVSDVLSLIEMYSIDREKMGLDETIIKLLKDSNA